MFVRLLLTDEAWAELAPILTAIKSRAGSPPVLSDRMFIEAVLYLARTGTPWRDLPEEFGHWDAVSNRFRRWERRGLWRQLWERLQTDTCPLTHHLFIDATIVRAHQHAAGALKKTRVAKSAGVSSSPTSRDTIRDHDESADAGSAADGGPLVSAAALARH
jgi:transposase